jgi:hypothetical protein
MLFGEVGQSNLRAVLQYWRDLDNEDEPGAQCPDIAAGIVLILSVLVEVPFY